MLKIKYRADGAYDKHKARVVARGFEAIPGLDFYSTFSPMACLASRPSAPRAVPFLFPFLSHGFITVQPS